MLTRETGCSSEFIHNLVRGRVASLQLSAGHWASESGGDHNLQQAVHGCKYHILQESAQPLCVYNILNYTFR